jgi:hypothetical protein
MLRSIAEKSVYRLTFPEIPMQFMSTLEMFSCNSKYLPDTKDVDKANQNADHESVACNMGGLPIDRSTINIVYPALDNLQMHFGPRKLAG